MRESGGGGAAGRGMVVDEGLRGGVRSEVRAKQPTFSSHRVFFLWRGSSSNSCWAEYGQGKCMSDQMVWVWEGRVGSSFLTPT